MTAQSLPDVISQLTKSADALAAIGAALDARLNDDALDPGIRSEVGDVLAALGLSAV